MPRKRRGGAYTITAAVRRVVRDPEAWEAHFGGPEGGRTAWGLLARQLVGDGGTRPEVWWAYTPGVPDALRTAPPVPDPREVLAGPPSAAFERAADRVVAFRRARLAWLLRSGPLSPEELVRVERRLAALPPAAEA